MIARTVRWLVVRSTIATALILYPVADLCAQHVHPSAADSGAGSPSPGIAVAIGRMASGTAWLPDRAPTTMIHRSIGDWRLMLDGAAALQYVRTTGIRRQWQLGSTNWVMGMASRAIGGGVLELRAMLSAEPATLTAMGSPQLLQVAQPYRGGTLTDRQHPHDLFGEIAVRFTRAIATNAAVELYVAPVGEPALGPVAYRHRPSSVHDHAAPLGHHAQDITHTTFGVVTVGIFDPRVKFEVSLFNGRHPDEDRTDLDLDDARLDSWSTRVTMNPSPFLSISGAFARFNPPDDVTVHAAHGAMNRFTASFTHVVHWAAHRAATSAVYGINFREGGTGLPSALIETDVELGSVALFGRAEHVRRTAEELALTGSVTPELSVRAFSLGVARPIHAAKGLEVRAILRGTVNVLPRDLAPFYGGARPLGLSASLALRPIAR